MAPLVDKLSFNMTMTKSIERTNVAVFVSLLITPGLGYYDFGDQCKRGLCILPILAATCGSGSLSIRIGDHMYAQVPSTMATTFSAGATSFTNITLNVTHVLAGVKNVEVWYSNALTSLDWNATDTVS